MRWEKPLEPLPCALAETVARASDSAASSLAPAARIGARGKVGRRLKSEAPCHADSGSLRLRARVRAAAFTGATMPASFVTSSATLSKFRVLTDCDIDASGAAAVMRELRSIVS